jgi:hypothetical protein
MLKAIKLTTENVFDIKAHKIRVVFVRYRIKMSFHKVQNKLSIISILIDDKLQTYDCVTTFAIKWKCFHTFKTQFLIEMPRWYQFTLSEEFDIHIFILFFN